MIGNVLKDIVDYLPKYQEYIQQLKEQGYTIVGYCRKSKQTNDDSEDRQRLLQQHVKKLKVRYLVDKVFVSVCCNAYDPIVDRDVQKNTIMNELTSVDGDMQGNIIYLVVYVSYRILSSFLDFLKGLSTEQKVCLVTLDSAGLTTNVDDLVSFL